LLNFSSIPLYTRIQKFACARWKVTGEYWWDTRNDMRISDNKISGPDIPDGTRPLCPQDQRGRRQTVVIISNVAALPPADMVWIIDVLDHNVDLVQTGRSGKASNIPTHRSFARQQLLGTCTITGSSKVWIAL
jgi:hypothetical protein